MVASSTASNLEREDHQRDADFNKAMHGSSAQARGGIAAMFKKGGSAKQAAVDEYFKHWDNKPAENETPEERAARTAEYATLTRHYYNLATDLYEYGWGQSFHFCRFSYGEPFYQAIARHEHYLAHSIGIKEGMKVLDVGCGVGGPAREIAKFTGAHITGLNNNDYQIQRATHYAHKEGLSNQLAFVKGDFMQMSFPDNSFDAVYAIEATVHAPTLKGIYSEIFRVLKPGGVFGVYEWLMTDEYDNDNLRHREIRLGIELGDGISNMCKVSEGLDAIRDSGFDMLHHEDMAVRPDPLPWYWPLTGVASDLSSNLESELDAGHKDASPPPPPTPANAPVTPPDSISSSFSSSLAYDDPATDGGWPPAFLADFESKFWMTYRSEFEPIPRVTNPQATSALSFSMRLKSQLGDQGDFSSDSGWGCMIRSGQSLLANTMAMISLGRDWRRGISVQEERQLVSAFADDPRAPYSIHSFVRHGATACGKYPGEWFGPSATARCIQALANSHESSLRVYSTGDGPDVYEDEFMKIAKPKGGEFHPTLILVGTRLGIDKITPVYWEALIASLQMHQSVGIAGGRPSSSHYFIGAQGSFLFYLDPHHTRTALPYHGDPTQYTDEEVGTCHTSRLRRIHVREMDPSMLIGFLIRSEEDWRDWRRCVKHVQGKAIIHVADHNPLLGGPAEGRQGAIDEVEPLSDDDTDTVHEA